MWFSILQRHLGSSSCIQIQNDEIVSDPNLDTLNRTINENSTKTCEYYAEIKAYQYMLHNNSNSQDSTNITTIASILYLLQSAGESLQSIEVSCCLLSYVCILDYGHFIITVQQSQKQNVLHWFCWTRGAGV